MEECYYPKPESFPLSIIFYQVFSFVEAVVGMSLNAFIIVVNCIDRMRNGHLKSIDKILTALGVSRCFYMFMIVVKVFWLAYPLGRLEDTRMYPKYKALTWFLNSVNFYFSACLSIFYCAKIANFQHYIFFLLKRNVSRLVPWMLLASMLASLTASSPFFNIIYIIRCTSNSTSDLLGNGTLGGFTLETDWFNLVLWSSLGFSVAFFISTTATFLLLFSLWRHTHQMQNQSASFSSPSTAAHFQAMKTITSLLVINVINFVFLLVLLSNVFPDNSFASRFSAILVNACPTMQSNLLIWANPKLKGEFIRVMHYIRHVFLLGRGVMRNVFCLPSKITG